MRVVVALVLAGCLDRTGTSGGLEPGVPGRGCERDAVCGGGLLCARNGGCYPASDIRAVRVDWTVRGLPASATSCEPSWTLEIQFRSSSSGDRELVYAPVPCELGRFSIDKLPRAYDSVTLGSRRAVSANGTIDPVTGEAQLDLGR
jgi:hypothetical protein